MRGLRRTAAVSIVSLVIVGTSVVASGTSVAAAPEIKPVDDAFSFAVDGVCSFPIRVRTHITGTELLFHDAQGNVTEDVIHLNVYGVWRNRDSGKSVIERDHLTGVVLPDDQGFLELGLNFHLSLPSGRTVLIDAGNLHFDSEGNLVFEAGNHQFEDGDFGALCAALS